MLKQSKKYNITIRFYEELNDFLPVKMYKKDIEYSFPGRRSIKDLIEAIGVPHVEVDLILVNGISENFSYIVRDKDRISVFPVFESFSIDSVSQLEQSPLRNLKFVLDVHLGKLARRMRLLGFDVDYQKQRDDSELAIIAEKESKILLTRDVQLLKRKNIQKGIFVRNTNPDKQIVEVLERFDLWSECRSFHRCIECNGIIRTLTDENALSYEGDISLYKDKIPKGVLAWCKEFFICSSCGKIYWKGSHYQKLQMIIDRIMSRKKENNKTTE